MKTVLYLVLLTLSSFLLGSCTPIFELLQFPEGVNIEFVVIAPLAQDNGTLTSTSQRIVLGGKISIDDPDIIVLEYGHIWSSSGNGPSDAFLDNENAPRSSFKDIPGSGEFRSIAFARQNAFFFNVRAYAKTNKGLVYSPISEIQIFGGGSFYSNSLPNPSYDHIEPSTQFSSHSEVDIAETGYIIHEINGEYSSLPNELDEKVRVEQNESDDGTITISAIVNGLNSEQEYSFWFYVEDIDGNITFSEPINFTTTSKIGWQPRTKIPDVIKGVDWQYPSISFVIGQTLYAGLSIVNNGLVSENYKDFWAYSLEYNTWTRLNDFPGVERNYSTSFVIDGQGYVGLGFSESDEAYQDLRKYDPGTDSWSSVASIPIRPYFDFKGPTPVVNNSKSYLVGESEYTSENTANLWVYSAQTDSWSIEGKCLARKNMIAFNQGEYLYTGLGEALYTKYGDINITPWNDLSVISELSSYPIDIGSPDYFFYLDGSLYIDNPRSSSPNNFVHFDLGDTWTSIADVYTNSSKSVGTFCSDGATGYVITYYDGRLYEFHPN